MHSTKDLFKSIFYFVSVLTLFLAFRWALFEPFVIPSSSMIPNLLVNDHILVDKSAFGWRYPFSKKWISEIKLPERGDVVVFKSVQNESMFMIKRVIGLPGDEVKYSRGGAVLVNDKPLALKEVQYEEVSFDFKNEANLAEKLKVMAMAQESLGAREYTVLNDERYESDEFETFVVPEGQLFFMGDNRDHSHDSRSWGSAPVENIVGKAKFVWLSCGETLPVISAMCHPLHIRWKRFFHNIK